MHRNRVRSLVLGIGIGTALQLADPIFQAFLTLLAACSGIDSHRRQIVSTDVTVQSVPVRIRLTLRRQSGLLQVWCQQTVVVVLQQYANIQVTGLLQRSVQQCYITKWKLIAVELVLCFGSHTDSQKCGKDKYFFHNHCSIRLQSYE